MSLHQVPEIQNKARTFFEQFTIYLFSATHVGYTVFVWGTICLRIFLFVSQKFSKVYWNDLPHPLRFHCVGGCWNWTQDTRLSCPPPPLSTTDTSKGYFLIFFMYRTISAALQIALCTMMLGSNPGQLQPRHWLSDALTTRLDLIHTTRLDLIH